MIRRSEEKVTVRKPAPFQGVGEITVQNLLKGRRLTDGYLFFTSSNHNKYSLHFFFLTSSYEPACKRPQPQGVSHIQQNQRPQNDHHCSAVLFAQPFMEQRHADQRQDHDGHNTVRRIGNHLCAGGDCLSVLQCYDHRDLGAGRHGAVP